jgi:hypothetical protein
MLVFKSNIHRKMLTKMNEGPIGGHYGFRTIMNKLLTIGYWWLSMQKEIVKLCQNYEIYVPRTWGFLNST